jgi:LAS superfamily LD-carboxypeptidase LdcB
MAINLQKLLPGSGALARVQKTNATKEKKVSDSLRKELLLIKNKLIQIDKLLLSNSLLQKKTLEIKRKQEESARFRKREERLEKRKDKEVSKNGEIETPQLGIFDRINRFITFTFLGWLVNKFVKYTPQVLDFVKKIGPVVNFIESFVGNTFKGIVNFIDSGYNAYDQVRDFTKKIGGDPFQKTFDDFSGNLNTFINLAIVAGMATMGGTDFGIGKGGGKPGAPARPGQGGRPKITTSGGGAAGRPNLRSPLRTKPTITTSGGKSLGRFAGLGGRIPIIGGLVSFIISVLSGEPVGRAAAKAVGFSIGSALGTFVPVPFVGTILGGILGDIVGGALYDTLIGNRPEKPKIKGKAKGGQVSTRKGKVVGGAIKRTERKVIQPPKGRPISPGASVGGENAIKRMFPEPTGTQIGKNMSPYGFITDTSNKMSEIPFLGPLFGLFGKVILGDTPTKTDYSNVGLGINAWINNAISKGDLQGNLIKGFADGGIIENNIQRNISGWIEKSVEELVKNKVTEAINNLRRNLGMEPLQESILRPTLPTEDGELGSASDAVGGARLLMAAGFPALAAAILSGNIQAESAWKGQRTPWILNDGAGTNKGLISWNRTRITNAERFLGKPLETASNAEQIKWIKEELKQYGLLDEFMNPQSTEAQLKDASYKYIRWGVEGNRWKYSRQIYAAIQKGEQGTYQPPSASLTRGPGGPLKDTGLKDSQGRSIRLVSSAAESLIQMSRDAQQQGINLGSGISNALRSPDQNRLVGGASGSRHLSGEAFDINWNTSAGIWIRNNANRYGFRYNPYSPQSTHFDWVGKKGGGQVGLQRQKNNIKNIQSSASYDDNNFVMMIQPIIIEKTTPIPIPNKTISFSGRGGVNSSDRISSLVAR